MLPQPQLQLLARLIVERWAIRQHFRKQAKITAGNRRGT
jgi:hypothetical protein